MCDSSVETYFVTLLIYVCTIVTILGTATVAMILKGMWKEFFK